MTQVYRRVCAGQGSFHLGVDHTRYTWLCCGPQPPKKPGLGDGLLNDPPPPPPFTLPSKGHWAGLRQQPEVCPVTKPEHLKKR
jgi:hypothetical protein